MPRSNNNNNNNNNGSNYNNNERTPLLQAVPIADHEPRYPHHTVRRIFTVALTTILTIALILVLAGSLLPGLNPGSKKRDFTYDQLKKILSRTPDPAKAREWSQYYTAGPHLAGKNLSQAEWTRDRWEEFGVASSVVAYDVYINYPLDNGLALLEDGNVVFKATLTEDVLDRDPTTGLDDRVPVFHGYSASGDVTASYVYCNYGTYSDFEELLKAKVPLEGKIALVKYGQIFRGLKVKRAEELGMVGVIIYTDPGDDGGVTEENGFKPYPDGPARQASSVQRGSVQYLSFAPGDPTTIGYPSKPGVPRMSPHGTTPRIPSIPLSYAEAIPILKALNGHGPNSTSFSKAWNGGGLGYKGVQYNIGPSPNTTQLHLVNKQEYVTNPIWNTIGIINGTISDEVVVVGNHRDAWIAGGAADPNSGSAALNEVVRSFGLALEQGWKPLRTIVFASWDGEEYGLIGSTEWVEEYLPWLSKTTVAYINVDVGAAGPSFSTASAPLINKALVEVLGQVPSPNQTVKGQTIRDVWGGEIDTMGSGSDFTAFQDFAGIASVDLGFKPLDAVYHYHSNYDSFYWMENFGDPGFKYHRAVAEIVNLLTAKFAHEPIIPFNATDYAVELERYLETVKVLASSKNRSSHEIAPVAFKNLERSLSTLKKASMAFDDRATHLAKRFASLDTSSSSSSSSFSSSSSSRAKLHVKARKINTAYKFLERQFLYEDGLDGRSWFKHVVFAPGRWTGYAGATFPGLVEAIEAGNETSTRRWADIINRRIEDAIKLLEDEA